MFHASRCVLQSCLQEEYQDTEGVAIPNLPGKPQIINIKQLLIFQKTFKNSHQEIEDEN